MNTLALQNKQNFPLTTDALRFMQDAYSALEQLGKLGGDNYILTGCTVTGSSVSSGWMVIGGKLMPFAGGSIQTNVRLVTTANTITVGTGTRDETVLTAEFGTSTNPAENVPWATLNANRPLALVDASNRIKALEPLNAAVEKISIEPYSSQFVADPTYGEHLFVIRQGRTYHLYFKLRTVSSTYDTLFYMPESIPFAAFSGAYMHGIAYINVSPTEKYIGRFSVRDDTRRVHFATEKVLPIGTWVEGNISWSN